MKLIHKMGITLGVVVFLAMGLGAAGGLSIIWLRRNAVEMEEITKHTSMLEDLKTKTHQWVISAESILRGEGVGNFFYVTSLLLEERISSFSTQPLPKDEQRLMESISTHFYKSRGQLEELLKRGSPKEEGINNEVVMNIREISREVEVLINSHGIHAEKAIARINKTEDIGKAISLAIPSTSILLAILLVLILGRGVINSVGTLVSASRTIAEGDLSKPIRLSSGDEFGEIARAFEEMRKELRQKEQKLAQLSITDELTGLYNRRYLNVKLEEEIARAKRFHHPLSVIFIDIDYFKKYNDRYGHLEGDKVLKCLAATVLENVRDKIDTACRYGGEEFTIIVPESNTQQALILAERILKGFSSKPLRPNTATGEVASEPIYATFSAGVTTFKEDEDSPEKFLHRADEALFKAKTQGRNRVITA